MAIFQNSHARTRCKATHGADDIMKGAGAAVWNGGSARGQLIPSRVGESIGHAAAQPAGPLALPVGQMVKSVRA